MAFEECAAREKIDKRLLFLARLSSPAQAKLSHISHSSKRDPQLPRTQRHISPHHHASETEPSHPRPEPKAEYAPPQFVLTPPFIISLSTIVA